MTLVYPVLAQILWTFIIMLVMGRARVGAVGSREVKMRDIALSGDKWPDRVRALGNNVSNQFETPVLFYALCGIGTYVGATGWGMAFCAWVYVASRLAHSFIHTGANDVRKRGGVFLVGMVALMAMWAGIVLRLAGAW